MGIADFDKRTERIRAQLDGGHHLDEDETPYDRRVRIECSIIAGTATVAEVEASIAPEQARWRRRLRDEAGRAYGRALEAAMPSTPSNPAFQEPSLPLSASGVRGLALAIVTTSLDQPYPADLYDKLEAIADGPRQLRAFPEHLAGTNLHGHAVILGPEHWLESGQAGIWAQAAAYRYILGPDKGAALREEAAADIAGRVLSHRELVARFSDDLRNNRGTRLQFLIWYQGQKYEMQEKLIAQALEHRYARSIGRPLPCRTIEDYAAALISYPPEETPPAELAMVLEACRDLAGPARSLELQNWYDANMWRGALTHRPIDLRKKADALWHTTGHTPTWGQLFNPDDPASYPAIVPAQHLAA
mgnify:CR=1 FL=1